MLYLNSKINILLPNGEIQNVLLKNINYEAKNESKYKEDPESELLGAIGYLSKIDLFKNKSNVFILRTFSKLYGLAALRVGWGYGDKKIIKELYKIKPPFKIKVFFDTSYHFGLGFILYTKLPPIHSSPTTDSIFLSVYFFHSKSIGDA